MSVQLPVLPPRERQAGGCCTAAVIPDLQPGQANDLAAVVKALADPTRLRIVDAVRKASPEALCQCDLVPLFAMSQAAVAKHLKVLIGAGILASERRGSWTYYYLRPGGLDGLTGWLA